MEPRIAGNPEPIEMGIQSVWRKTGGREYERRWWGLASEIRAFEQGIRAPAGPGRTPPPNPLGGAIEVSISQSPGSAIAILTARFNGTLDQANGEPEIAIETMEIAFKDETFPLHQNPGFIDIPTSQIKALDVEAKTDAPDEAVGVNHVAQNASEGAYLQYRMRGVESYRVKLPHVTWTRTVGEGYNAALDLADTGAIFSTGDLASSIGAPILFSIPTGNVGVESSGVSPFTAGWMKGAQLTYVSDGRIQMILTAEYGLWANDVYVFV